MIMIEPRWAVLWILRAPSDEEALHQSEEKYRTFIETIQDGYYETDLSGKYTFVNDVICDHLKYSKEELIGTDNRQYQMKQTLKKTYQVLRKSI